MGGTFYKHKIADPLVSFKDNDNNNLRISTLPKGNAIIVASLKRISLGTLDSTRSNQNISRSYSPHNSQAPVSFKATV